MERGWKPNVEISPNCPRCGSSNTKFCYYNNYSLTQPRYFCKGCRRYWTKGGSLRNVPIGGGCRKNRRGKSFRVSPNGVPSKSLAFEGVPNDPIGHSYGSKGSSLVESTSSSLMPDASHIDLALVYANFLNQQPNSKTEFEMPELPSDFNPSLEFSTLLDTNLDTSIDQLPGGNSLLECLTPSHRFAEPHMSDSNGNKMYFCAFEPIQNHKDRVQRCTSLDTSNYTLPPLPSEEVPSQELSWSYSQVMVNHTLQGTDQLPVLGPEAQDPNLLLGNWSPFDLSSDDTFSRP